MSEEGGLVVLKGNLAPDGAVIEHTAAEPQLHQHKGPAVVFKEYNDMSMRIDDVNLDITKDSVIVLQNAGPVGGPGMPEWGQLPIPQKLLKEGVRDMVRISDARMMASTVPAFCNNESFIGGPLALVQDGDMVELDVPGRRLHLDVSDEERPDEPNGTHKPHYPRGYGWMYAQRIGQANEGCDFDFLEAGDEDVPEPSSLIGQRIRKTSPSLQRRNLGVFHT